MAIEVKIPAVGESITSGVVSAWHKKSGDFVNEGETLFTLETDKVSTEIVAEKAGLLETKVPEGQEVKIGEVVATIDDSKQRSAEKKVPEAKKAEKPPEKKKEPVEKKREPEAVEKTVEEREKKPPPEEEKPLSPAVRHIVEEEKLEPEKIPGTGRSGRLTKADVLAAVEERGDADLSGVAVGTERGLVVPVVRDADKKSFANLERDIADYAARAREGKLKVEDLQGGTFTITNGGVYGSLFATPILNPPQSGILGMHKIMPRPVAVDGKVEVRPMMYLALSYDHRAIDGKEAVTFLIKVKECIEDPKKLPLDF